MWHVLNINKLATFDFSCSQNGPKIRVKAHNCLSLEYIIVDWLNNQNGRF